MASISRAANGRRSIQFMGLDGKRKTVRLGDMTAKDAEQTKTRVEHILSARAAGEPFAPGLSDWLAGIGEDLAEKLAAAGLTPPRLSSTLGAFLDGYRERRCDVKEASRTAWRTAQNRITGFFSAERNLRDITAADAEDFALHLHREEYAQATLGRTLKMAKQFFKDAVKRKLIRESPFAEIKAPGQTNRERLFNVTREMTAKLLDACPDAEWRLIVALSRYGGLRCPSEHLALGWPDVNWELNRFRVTSSKTEHHEGRAERWVPIFPELRPFLEDVFDQAQPGALHVITRYRDAKQNLRTRLLAYIRKAGLTPWPRLFQNLRATRETELAATWPAHVVCEWIGNSERIAAKHYLHLTEDDWTRAASSALQNALQRPATPSDTERHGNPSDETEPVGVCISTLLDVAGRGPTSEGRKSFASKGLGTEGLEDPAFSNQETHFSEKRAAESDATRDVAPCRSMSLDVGSPELAEIASAWDGLPAGIRAGIMALVRSAK